MKILSLFSVLCLMFSAPLAMANDAAILGKWTTKEGKSHIETSRFLPEYDYLRNNQNRMLNSKLISIEVVIGK